LRLSRMTWIWPLGMLGHDLVHEVEELDAPAPAVMLGVDLAAGNVERCEQGGSAMSLVVMGLAGQRAPIGQLEIALRPLQRLDRRLLVHRQHQRAVGRVKIEPDNLRRLGCEGRVVALAPGLAGRKVDLLCTQEAPDILHIESLSSAAINGPLQRSCPAGTGRSSTARMRLSVSTVYLGSAPRSPVSSSPAKRSRA